MIKSAAENNSRIRLNNNNKKKRETVRVWGVWLGLARKADTKFYWNDDTPMAKLRIHGLGYWRTKQR